MLFIRLVSTNAIFNAIYPYFYIFFFLIDFQIKNKKNEKKKNQINNICLISLTFNESGILASLSLTFYSYCRSLLICQRLVINPYYAVTTFDDPEEKASRKHCGKRRKCW